MRRRPERLFRRDRELSEEGPMLLGGFRIWGGLMAERARRCCLLLIAILPITAVSFAAKSALNVAQINIRNATDDALSGGGQESAVPPPDSRQVRGNMGGGL